MDIDRETHVSILLRLADDHLILGHRLSEWCGHAPMLEEDLALPNIALDLIGQARALYQHAGAVEGRGRGEDDFAYLRRERHYTNCMMVERPNGDFAETMLRQLFFASFMQPMWKGLEHSTDAHLAAIAAKAGKEVAYHIRHAGEWVIRLGDGTEESARRMQAAMEALAPYVPELFETDAVTRQAAADGLAPEPATLRPAFDAILRPILSDAFLDLPAIAFPKTGGRSGIHGEAMGFLLADLQFMQRAYPGMTW